jgi:CrcB protein
MLKLIFIAAGGILGALLRYGISGLIQGYLNSSFPWGTLIVNLLGCFMIGFLWQISELIIISPNIRVFIFVGVLGAFTTFSTYGLETINLLRESEIKYALSNIFLSNILGLLMVFCGFIAVRYVVQIFK